MAHMYWTARCKTEDCFGLQVAKYIGDYDSREKAFRLPAVKPKKFFEVQCEMCLEVHTFEWKDLTASELPKAPGPDFHPWF
jgi:hypothetical protein